MTNNVNIVNHSGQHLPGGGSVFLIVSRVKMFNMFSAYCDRVIEDPVKFSFIYLASSLIL